MYSLLTIVSPEIACPGYMRRSERHTSEGLKKAKQQAKDQPEMQQTQAFLPRVGVGFYFLLSFHQAPDALHAIGERYGRKETSRGAMRHKKTISFSSSTRTLQVASRSRQGLEAREFEHSKQLFD